MRGSCQVKELHLSQQIPTTYFMCKWQRPREGNRTVSGEDGRLCCWSAKRRGRVERFNGSAETNINYLLLIVHAAFTRKLRPFASSHQTFPKDPRPDVVNTGPTGDIQKCCHCFSKPQIWTFLKLNVGAVLTSVHIPHWAAGWGLGAGGGCGMGLTHTRLHLQHFKLLFSAASVSFSVWMVSLQKTSFILSLMDSWEHQGKSVTNKSYTKIHLMISLVWEVGHPRSGMCFPR